MVSSTAAVLTTGPFPSLRSGGRVALGLLGACCVAILAASAWCPAPKLSKQSALWGQAGLSPLLAFDCRSASDAFRNFTMVEPTPEERATLRTFAQLADWCEMGEPAKLALYEAMGADADSGLKAVGHMGQEDFDKVVSDITVQGKPPTPLVTAAFRLFGHAARVVTGSVPTKDERAKKEAQELAQATRTTDPGSGGGKAGIVKMASVVDQGLEDEIPSLPDSTYQAGYNNYRRRLGDVPPRDEEPSLEQLSGIAHLLSLKAPPYADFSIFGPHALRLRKRLKFSGYVFSGSGTLERAEQFGPPTFQEWSKCYRVLATALIMLDEVSPARLAAYSTLIERFLQTYTPVRWPAIYQADVRCRQEHTRAIRRKGIERHDRGPRGAEKAGFSADHPWEYVWRVAVEDSDFWLREVQEKSILILTRTATLGRVLDGDAMVATHGAFVAAPPDLEPPTGRRRSRSRQRASAASSSRAVARQHNAGADGMMTTNRKGRRLCPGFQTGECDKLVDGKPGFLCSRDPSMSHQCAKCLSPLHGASSCNNAAAKRPNVKGKAKGGGGKGFGGGRIQR